MENINILMDIYFNSKYNDETIAFRQSSIDNIKKFILTFPSNEELEYMVDILNSNEKSKRYCRSIKDASEMEMEFILYCTNNANSSIMRYFIELLGKNLITKEEYEISIDHMSLFCRRLLQSRITDVVHKKYATIRDKPVRDFISLLTDTMDGLICIDIYSYLISSDASGDSRLINRLSSFVRGNNLNFIRNELDMYLSGSNSILLKRIRNTRNEMPHLDGLLDNLDNVLKTLALNLIKEM